MNMSDWSLCLRDWDGNDCSGNISWEPAQIMPSGSDLVYISRKRLQQLEQREKERDELIQICKDAREVLLKCDALEARSILRVALGIEERGGDEAP